MLLSVPSIMISVGNRIRLNNRLNGTVRYIGSLKQKAGTWIGLEVDEPEGKNDGSIDGTRYFLCADKHGIFIRQDILIAKIHKMCLVGENLQKNAEEDPEDLDYKYENSVQTIIKDNLYLAKIAKLKNEIVELQTMNINVIEKLKKENEDLRSEVSLLNERNARNHDIVSRHETLISKIQMAASDAASIIQDMSGEIEHVSDLLRNHRPLSCNQTTNPLYDNVCIAFKSAVLSVLNDNTDEINKNVDNFNKLVNEYYTT